VQICREAVSEESAARQGLVSGRIRNSGIQNAEFGIEEKVPLRGFKTEWRGAPSFISHFSFIIFGPQPATNHH